MVSQASKDRQRAARENRNYRFKFKRVAFHLTTSQIRKLKERSKADGQPFAEHLRLAIDAYLDAGSNSSGGGNENSTSSKAGEQ